MVIEPDEQGIKLDKPVDEPEEQGIRQPDLEYQIKSIYEEFDNLNSSTIGKVSKILELNKLREKSKTILTEADTTLTNVSKNSKDEDYNIKVNKSKKLLDSAKELVKFLQNPPVYGGKTKKNRKINRKTRK